MTKIKVTADDEKIVIERDGKATFEEVFDAIRKAGKLIPIAKPYPYLDSFIQIFGTRDMKFFKMIGRDIQFFNDGITDKLTMLSFKPTNAEIVYINNGIVEDVMSILR